MATWNYGDKSAGSSIEFNNKSYQVRKDDGQTVYEGQPGGSANLDAFQQQLDAFKLDMENTSGVGGLPVGVVIPFAGEKIPTGWLICDGREVKRTQYSRLYDSVGDKYGAGDGSTTFNLPDMRGRVVAGLSDNNDVLSGAMNLGQKKGDQTHKLTLAQLPSHNHGGVQTVSTSTSTQLSLPIATGGTEQKLSAKTWYPLAARSYWQYNQSNWFNWVDYGNLTGSATSSFTLPAAGGGQTHNNVQPTMILNYIINTVPGGSITAGHGVASQLYGHVEFKGENNSTYGYKKWPASSSKIVDDTWSTDSLSMADGSKPSAAIIFTNLNNLNDGTFASNRKTRAQMRYEVEGLGGVYPGCYIGSRGIIAGAGDSGESYGPGGQAIVPVHGDGKVRLKPFINKIRPGLDHETHFMEAWVVGLIGGGADAPESNYNDLKRRMEALENKPATTVDLSAYAKKSDISSLSGGGLVEARKLKINQTSIANIAPGEVYSIFTGGRSGIWHSWTHQIKDYVHGTSKIYIDTNRVPVRTGYSDSNSGNDLIGGKVYSSGGKLYNYLNVFVNSSGVLHFRLYYTIGDREEYTYILYHYK